MKKNYESSSLGKKIRKGVLAASMLGSAFMSENLLGQSYCQSSATYSGDDEIFNVTFGPMNNTSSCGSSAGPNSISGCYQNFLSPLVAASNYTQGTNYALSVTVGQCNGWTYSGYVGVWIDYNQNGSFLDPGEQIFMSGSNLWQIAGTVITAGGGITIPTGAIPGITRMRVVASEYNQPVPCNNSVNNTYYYGETEDYNVNIISNTPCITTPAANSVAGPTAQICPNTAAFVNLQTPYLVGNITYQWASSTVSNVGPFLPINTATNSSYVTPNLTQNTWYQLVATCANGGVATTASAFQVTVAPTTINTVPYLESFEGTPSSISELPNCSWTRTNPTNCKTSNVATFSNRMPYTGNGYANFDYGNTGTSNTYNFYSNGIQLNVGVTYSASVYYITPGWSAWSNVSLKYGPNQNQTGIISLASVTSPQNNTYKSLSNTFQVATSGIYYLNISATDNYGYSYLTFDDVAVIAPCTFSNNAANLTLTAPSAICAGQTANLTAAGVNSYSWSTGPTTSGISVTPGNSTTYSVTGTNTLSGCRQMLTAPITVNPLPGVQIYAPTTSICEGESVILFASGSANTYSWSNGPSIPLNNVTPNSTTTYSVVGVNSYGCMTVASQLINVNALPTINVTGSTNICRGEPGTLTGNGANSYKWSATSAFLQTNPIAPYPQVNTTYTVTGTDVNGCEGTTVVNMVVNACTGIATVNGNISGLSVYPNPNNGEFTIELSNGLAKTITVIDVTGRTVVANTSSNDQVNVNISNLANGVYYVKVKSDNAVEVLKVVKQ